MARHFRNDHFVCVRCIWYPHGFPCLGDVAALSWPKSNLEISSALCLEPLWRILSFLCMKLGHPLRQWCLQKSNYQKSDRSPTFTKPTQSLWQLSSTTSHQNQVVFLLFIRIGIVDHQATVESSLHSLCGDHFNLLPILRIKLEDASGRSSHASKQCAEEAVQPFWWMM